MKTFLFIILIILPYSLFSEVGVTSLSFLDLSKNPVDAAWQGGGYAMGSGILGLGSNPAIPALQDYTELLMGYQMLPFDNTIQHLSYTKPTLLGTVGLGLVFSGQQDLTVYDSEYNESSVSNYDMAASFYHSVMFFDMLLGTKTTLIHSQIADYSALTFAIDWGGVVFFDIPSIFKRSKNSNLGLGISVKGLSPGIRYGAVSYPLPLTYGGGAYYNLTNFNFLESNIELFYNRSHSISHSYGVALELKTFNYFTIRGGLSYSQYDLSDRTALNFSGGFSLLLDVQGYVYDIVYSIEPSENLGIQHQVAMRIQFGGGKKWPLGIDRLFSMLSSKDKKENVSIREKINNEVQAQKSEEDDDDGIAEEDKIILYLLRNSVAKFMKQRGRYPVGLNELLLFLNDYHVYEIPNPKIGKYRYNKRTGRLFIRK